MPEQATFETEIDVQPVYRVYDVGGIRTRKDEDEDERYVLDLTFSSEFGVERWGFIEVLDHNPESVRLERLLDGAPFLMDHRHEIQAGVVETASIEGKRGRASILLSRNARSLPGYGVVISDIEDNIRRKVSVGYRIHRAVLEEERNDGPDVYRVTDWEPFEISLVSVPADNTVGVGRSLDLTDEHDLSTNKLTLTGTRTMPDENKVLSDAEVRAEIQKKAAASGDAGERTTVDVNVGDIVRQTVTALKEDDDVERQAPAKVVSNNGGADDERARIRGIDEAVDMVAKLGVDESKLRELRNKHVNDPNSHSQRFFSDAMNEFESAVLDRQSPQTIGMSERDIGNFSITRLGNFMAKVKQGKASQRDYNEAGFEIEVTTAAEQVRDGRENQGMIIPDDLLYARNIPLDAVAPGLRSNAAFMASLASVQQRDLTVGGIGTADNLVSTDLVSYIDLLRARSVLRNMGARSLDGLTGDVAIPRLTSGSAAYFIAENDDATESTPEFDQVALTPKTMAIHVDISRKTLIQSYRAADAIVMADMAIAAALKFDQVGIAGNPDATATPNDPRGILYTTGIGVANGVGLSRDLPIDLETAVAVDNADMGSLGYITNPKVRGALKKTRNDSGSGTFVWETGSSELNGYNASVTTQVPSDLTAGSATGLSALIFGNFDDMILATWSGLDMIVDSYSLSLKGAMRLVAFQDVDVAIRHPESFSAATDLATP